MMSPMLLDCVLMPDKFMVARGKTIVFESASSRMIAFLLVMLKKVKMERLQLQ